jgi:hypothetical protein
MCSNLHFLRWIKKYWDVHYYGRTFDPESCRSVKSSERVKSKPRVDATSKLEASLINQEDGSDQKKREGKEKKPTVFYSDPKFRGTTEQNFNIAAPPISIGLIPIEKTYENQQRYTCNSMPEKDKKAVPAQFTAKSNREKEGEAFKKRVGELKQRLKGVEKIKTDVEAENNLLGSKIDEVKRVISWRNKENIEEVFEQLALILTS